MAARSRRGLELHGGRLLSLFKTKVKGPEVLRQFVFVGPAALLFLIAVAVPFVLGVYYSMTDWNGISKTHSFIGLQNYIQIFSDDAKFLRSFWFTVRISVVITVLMNVLGFLVALLLMNPFRFRNGLRTSFFMPNVLGGLVLGFIWQFIFTKGFEALGASTGWSLFQIPWLATESTAFWAVVLVTVWQGMGYVMVIYIAGLSNIPAELKEAARVDGANKWVMLSRITFPLIMSSITICLFWSINVTLKIFDVNISLTNGGPFGTTESVTLNLYYSAFRDNFLGVGSAKAVIFFLIVVLITSVQVYFTKRKEVEA
ncbi:sugar ABC transporter permease [Paenibacillus sp. S150]|nr:sugar ABC transporter permease [Paenibacillus sp. S150]